MTVSSAKELGDSVSFLLLFLYLKRRLTSDISLLSKRDLQTAGGLRWYIDMFILF